MTDLLLVPGWVASVWDSGSAEGLRRVASLSLGSVQGITALPERCSKFAHMDVTAVMAIPDLFAMCDTQCICIYTLNVEIQRVANVNALLGCWTSI